MPVYAHVKDVVDPQGKLEAVEINYMKFLAFNGSYKVRCAALHCAALCCAVLCCIESRRAVLYCIESRHAALCCAVPQFTLHMLDGALHKLQ